MSNAVGSYDDWKTSCPEHEDDDSEERFQDWCETEAVQYEAETIVKAIDKLKAWCQTDNGFSMAQYDLDQVLDTYRRLEQERQEKQSK